LFVARLSVCWACETTDQQRNITLAASLFLSLSSCPSRTVPLIHSAAPLAPSLCVSLSLCLSLFAAAHSRSPSFDGTITFVRWNWVGVWGMWGGWTACHEWWVAFIIGTRCYAVCVFKSISLSHAPSCHRLCGFVRRSVRVCACVHVCVCVCVRAHLFQWRASLSRLAGRLAGCGGDR